MSRNPSGPRERRDVLPFLVPLEEFDGNPPRKILLDLPMFLDPPHVSRSHVQYDMPGRSCPSPDGRLSGGGLRNCPGPVRASREARREAAGSRAAARPPSSARSPVGAMTGRAEGAEPAHAPRLVRRCARADRELRRRRPDRRPVARGPDLVALPDADRAAVGTFLRSLCATARSGCPWCRGRRAPSARTRGTCRAPTAR